MNSSIKGSKFERKTNRELSLWISYGERDDLFTRNVLSGGQFTSAAGKRGLPGDAASLGDPLAYAFLQKFVMEYKHRASLGIEAFLFDAAGTSFLCSVFEQTRRQASPLGRRAMIVARQNLKPTLLLMDASIALSPKANKRRLMFLPKHIMHNGAMVVVLWDSFREYVDPRSFVDGNATLP